MQDNFNSDNILIILSSDEPWGDVWHTQLHYAYQLSKRFPVFYVNPPGKWKFRNLFRWKINIEKINKGLLIVNYHNVFPITYLNKVFVKLNDCINSYFIKKNIPREKTNIIFWRFDHFRLLMHPFFKPAFSIYHIVDQYMGEKNDDMLARKSDLVIVTSPRFMNYYAGLNKNVINVPQAIGKEELICDESLADSIKKEYKKIILFIGTLSSEINFDILQRISEKFRNHTLLIIGPDRLSVESEKKKFNALSSLKNVAYIGTVPGPELKNYVKVSEACIIPYKFNFEKKMSIRSPLKAISYIAQKKVVITSIDCEINELENKMIYKAASVDEFISFVGDAVENKMLKDDDAADAFIRSISYDERIDYIFSKLNH